MKTAYRKKFLKELSHLPLKTRLMIENFAFEEMPQILSISENKKIERLKSYKNFFKVRFGNYRVGLRIEDDEIIFERVLHRKEIYKFFP